MNDQLKALEQIKAAEATLLLPTYERNPLLFVSGEGVYLEDEHGDKYLDLLSGIGVNALGYAHPAIERAIAEQSKRLIHTRTSSSIPARPNSRCASPKCPASTAPSSATAAPRHGKRR